MIIDAIIQSTEALEEAVQEYNHLTIQKNEYIQENNEKKVLELDNEIVKIRDYILSLISNIDKLIDKEKNASRY